MHWKFFVNRKFFGIAVLHRILSFNSELPKLSHFSLLLLINKLVITRKRWVIDFSTGWWHFEFFFDESLRFMKIKLWEYSENVKNWNYTIMLKVWQRHDLYPHEWFARFVHSSKLHGGYVLIQEGTVNATCPKIRNYSRKRKILKSFELFYLFETDLRCGWIWM